MCRYLPERWEPVESPDWRRSPRFLPPAWGGEPAGSHPSKTAAAGRRIVAGMTDQTIFPALRYSDAPAAIEWLGRAFGFEPRMGGDRPGGTPAHPRPPHDGAPVMLRSTPPPGPHDHRAQG